MKPEKFTEDKKSKNFSPAAASEFVRPNLTIYLPDSKELFIVVRKPLARRVVPKKTIVDNEGRKTPFAIIDARSGNCTKEAKGGHSE